MKKNKTCYCKTCQELQLKLDAMQKEIDELENAECDIEDAHSEMKWRYKIMEKNLSNALSENDKLQKEIEYWKGKHSKQVEKQENDSYYDLD